MQELENLRKIIDVLDDEIISLISERQVVSERIGKLKSELKIAVLDKAREEYLQDYHKELSEKYSVSPEFVVELFELIFTESRKTQEHLKQVVN